MEKIEYTVTEFHGPDAKCPGTLVDLILDAHIIPPCGLIPPFRVILRCFAPAAVMAA